LLCLSFCVLCSVFRYSIIMFITAYLFSVAACSIVLSQFYILARYAYDTYQHRVLVNNTIISCHKVHHLLPYQCCYDEFDNFTFSQLTYYKSLYDEIYEISDYIYDVARVLNPSADDDTCARLAQISAYYYPYIKLSYYNYKTLDEVDKNNAVSYCISRTATEFRKYFHDITDSDLRCMLLGKFYVATQRLKFNTTLEQLECLYDAAAVFNASNNQVPARVIYPLMTYIKSVLEITMSDYDNESDSEDNSESSEAESESNAESEAESESNAESEAESSSEESSSSETGDETESDAESESNAESEAESESNAETETGAPQEIETPANTTPRADRCSPLAIAEEVR